MRHAFEAHYAVGVYQHRVRNPTDLDRFGSRGFGINAHRIINFGLGHSTDRLLSLIRNADDYHPILEPRVNSVQNRNRAPAWATPGRPKIYEHELSMGIRRVRQPLLNRQIRSPLT